jgi:protein-S-isoprenylcysteine O-methyltransferase Ste14
MFRPNQPEPRPVTKTARLESQNPADFALRIPLNQLGVPRGVELIAPTDYAPAVNPLWLWISQVPVHFWKHDAARGTPAPSSGRIAVMLRRTTALAETLLFTVVAPGTIAGYIPWRLRTDSPGMLAGPQKWLAIILIGIGVAIYLHTAFWGFAWSGGGTPAPIAPTKKLVAGGLHRYVRNPMYIGVFCIVGGEAWLFRSRHILIYLACAIVIVNLFVLFYEEPTLHRQFGEEYDRYRATVPRWTPKFKR